MYYMEDGCVSIDAEGHIWWHPGNGKPDQLLTEHDDLCGAGVFETSADDPFRDCCAWHDRAYELRAFFEERGWNRKKIDDYFLRLMHTIAGSDVCLFYRANTYHSFVRMFGWIYYYRHPAYIGNLKRDSAWSNQECERKLHEIVEELKDGSKESSSSEGYEEETNEGR